MMILSSKANKKQHLHNILKDLVESIQISKL